MKAIPDSTRRTVRFDGNTEPHFHFLDENSGELLDLEGEVKKLVPILDGLGGDIKVSGVEVTIRGQRPNRHTSKNKIDV